jgi:hypothetical protein
MTHAQTLQLLQTNPQVFGNPTLDMRYSMAYAAVNSLIAVSEDEAHCVIDGKWIWQDLPFRKTGNSKSLNTYQDDWLEEIRMKGHSGVKTWWNNFTGQSL